MIYDRPLTAEERKRSQYNYNCYNLINGASYMCLGETVIVLFAVRIGMPNPVVSLIGAMLYFGYLLLPLGIWSTARFGAARSQANFWICRNIAVLLVASSAFFYGTHPIFATAVLLTGSFLFYGFRAAGCVMAQPLIGCITSDEERPGLIAKSTGYFYLTGVVMLVILSLALKIYDNLFMLLGIILFGAVCGITASAFLRNIDETSVIKESARKPLFSELSRLMQDRTVFRLTCAWFAANFAILMIIPVSLLALKRGFGISDTNAILFSILQFSASIPGSYCGAFLSRSIGPRRILLFAYPMLLLAGLFWILPPISAPARYVLFTLPFLLQGTASILLNNALTHYFLMAVPKKNQVGSSVLICLITAAAAGVIGIFATGGLVRLAEHLAQGMPSRCVFHIYFLMALLISVCGYPLFFRMKTVLTEFKETHTEEELTETCHRIPRMLRF